MLGARGRLGWALAAIVLISACSGGTTTTGGPTSTPGASKTLRIGSFDRPVAVSYTHLTLPTICSV